MANIIHEIDSIDAETQRFRERRKMKIERAFDTAIWDLLAALGYEGTRSKERALPELPTLIEQVEQERKNVPSEVEHQGAENAPAQSQQQTY